jgi:hypothetical protein
MVCVSLFIGRLIFRLSQILLGVLFAYLHMLRQQYTKLQRKRSAYISAGEAELGSLSSQILATGITTRRSEKRHQIIAGLSATATIIGVVSFGLTVCQGLVAYYADFAHANEDVARLLRSMSQLTNNLTFLEETISGSKNFDPSSITTAEKCIRNCQDSIDRLNQDLGMYSSPTVFHRRSRRLSRGGPSWVQ